jgi:hypothetical protein
MVVFDYLLDKIQDFQNFIEPVVVGYTAFFDFLGNNFILRTPSGSSRFSSSTFSPVGFYSSNLFFFILI